MLDITRHFAETLDIFRLWIHVVNNWLLSIGKYKILTNINKKYPKQPSIINEIQTPVYIQIHCRLIFQMTVFVKYLRCLEMI